jgi:hypothetical protein
MKKIIIIIIISLSLQSYSQKFAYKALLPKVDSSGYYHIFLPPDVTSKLNYKFSDLRLYDKKGREIPYIRLSDDEMFKTAKYREIKILSNQYRRQKKYTHILIDNKKKYNINNLVLVVDNPQGAEAWINLAGSNDRKIWNVLKNNSRYLPEFSDSSTTEIRINDIPQTNFEYYRILLYDFGKTSFKVHKVLNYELANRKIDYIEVMKPKFTQDDTSEANKSIISIYFKEPQYIDKMVFKITQPPYYLRKAEITKKDSLSGKRIRLKLYDQNQKDFYLCSDSSNTLLLPRYYVQNLYLIVMNNDDEPLKFSDIRAYQKKEYIIAYLNKNKRYQLLFGNKNVPPPIYDLKYFKYKIPLKCPVISAGGIIKLVPKKRKEKNIQVAPIYLWIVFIIVVLILSGISLKMFVFAKNNNKKINDIDI